jgi:hypothetical protein
MARPRCLAGLAVLLCTVTAQAHVVYGTKTLHGLTAESDLVLRARIVTVDGGQTASAPQGSRPGVEAKVLEVLKGFLGEPRVSFAQHGHGVAQFEPGHETLLFLIDIARSRELDALEGRYAWVSLQEHQDEYPLEPATRDPLLRATRAYVAADAVKSPEARMATLRQATLGLLTSGDPQLAASALRDLVAAPAAAPLVTPEELPALRAVLDDPKASMGVRVALLTELERRQLVAGPLIWLGLLSDEIPARDRITAIRAAGASAHPPVLARLIVLLADPDANVAAAAAAALGKRGNREAVASLAAALSHDSPKVRMAAIRGLGQIQAPEARQALEAAAASHPDPATKRRARAEVRKRDRGAP